jgi:hypothetical protein
MQADRLEDFQEAAPWMRTAIAVVIYAASRAGGDTEEIGPEELRDKCYKTADLFMATLKADLEANT